MSNMSYSKSLRYAEVKINVDNDFGLKRLDRLQHKKVPKAAAEALNNAISKTRVYLKSALSNSAGIKKVAVASKMKLVKASANRLVATVKMRDGNKRWPNLASHQGFTAPIGKSGRRNKAGKRAWGARAKIWGKRRFYKGVFAWKRAGRGGEAVTAFSRVGQKVKPTKRTGGDGQLRRYKRGPNKGKVILRQKLKPIYGADIVREFDKEKQSTIPQQKARQAFNIRFKHNMERALNRGK